MKKILTINKPDEYSSSENHPCLASLELDNPLSRVDAPAAIMELEAQQNVIPSERVRLPFLRSKRDVLFKIGDKESYITILNDHRFYIRYDIVEVADDAAWTIVKDDNCEFVLVAEEGDTIVGKDDESGYCQSIQKKYGLD